MDAWPAESGSWMLVALDGGGAVTQPQRSDGNIASYRSSSAEWKFSLSVILMALKGSVRLRGHLGKLARGWEWAIICNPMPLTLGKRLVEVKVWSKKSEVFALWLSHRTSPSLHNTGEIFHTRPHKNKTDKPNSGTVLIDVAFFPAMASLARGGNEFRLSPVMLSAGFPQTDLNIWVVRPDWGASSSGASESSSLTMGHTYFYTQRGHRDTHTHTHIITHNHTVWHLFGRTVWILKNLLLFPLLKVEPELFSPHKSAEKVAVTMLSQSRSTRGPSCTCNTVLLRATVNTTEFIWFWVELIYQWLKNHVPRFPSLVWPWLTDKQLYPWFFFFLYRTEVLNAVGACCVKNFVPVHSHLCPDQYTSQDVFLLKRLYFFFLQHRTGNKRISKCKKKNIYKN